MCCFVCYQDDRYLLSDVPSRRPSLHHNTLSATEIQRTTFGCCTWITWCQNGTLSPRPLGPYRARRRSRFPGANSLRRSGGVARIIHCGLHDGMASDWPFTAQHGGQPRAQARRALAGGIVLYREPADFGTPERVRTTDIATPARPEELAGSPCSSWPSRWPISCFRRLPQSAQDTSSRRRGWRWRDTGAPISDRFLTPAPPPAGQVSPWRLSVLVFVLFGHDVRTESSLSLRAWFSSSSSSMRSLRSGVGRSWHIQSPNRSFGCCLKTGS